MSVKNGPTPYLGQNNTPSRKDFNKTYSSSNDRLPFMGGSGSMLNKDLKMDTRSESTVKGSS